MLHCRIHSYNAEYIVLFRQTCGVYRENKRIGENKMCTPHINVGLHDITVWVCVHYDLYFNA